MKVAKRFTFDAAHQLKHLPSWHKCSRLHGHTYTVEIECEGPVKANGMVVDYAEISVAVEPLIGKLDHTNLNDTLPISTAENLAVWFWQKLPTLPLSRITIFETASTRVDYNGK